MKGIRKCVVPILRKMATQTKASPKPTSKASQGYFTNSKSPVRVWKASDFRYTADPHPSVRLTCPALHVESFDLRDQNPKITSIMTTSTMGRSYSLHLPISLSKPGPTTMPDKSPGSADADTETFLNWGHLTTDLYTFMSSTEFVMERGVYNNLLPKWNMTLEHTLGFVGNCSVAFVTKYYTQNNDEGSGEKGNSSGEGVPGKDGNGYPNKGELLWTNTYQMVAVDKVTRMPTKLPAWFKDNYNGRGCRSNGFALRPFDRPEKTFVNKYTVNYSDTDFYKHTTWTTYPRWAIDAIHAAISDKTASSSSSALRGLTREITERGLHKIQINYMRELLEGDEVSAHVWQDPYDLDPGHVLVSITKQDEDVCQLRLWYFGEDDDEDIPF